MIPVKHIDPEDIPLYAMQLLSPEEMEEMCVHMQHSVEGRRVLAEVYSDLSYFAHTAEMHSPPALARQRLMKHVAREKKAIPIDRMPAGVYAPRETPGVFEEPVKRGFAARALPWAGWALAAGMAFEAGHLYQQRESLKTTVAQDHTQLAQTQVQAEQAALLLETVKDPGAAQFVLTSTGAKAPPEARASYVAEKGSLIFLASNLEPLRAYKTYELWLIPADGRDPIPAGTFRPDERGNASVVMPPLPKGVKAATFGVTIEDGDGSSLPTMPIILKGQPT